MGNGLVFKQGFEVLLQSNGGPVKVTMKPGAAEESSRTVQALKNRKKSRNNEDVFQFEGRLPIVIGDLIQQVGSEFVWQVVAIDESIIGGVFVMFEAYVERTDRRPAAPSKSGHSITVGTLNGPLQVGDGRNVIHNQTTVVQQVHDEIDRLVSAVTGSDLPEIEKDEVRHELDRVKMLAGQEQSPDVANKAMTRLERVRAAVEVSAGLATVATPMIEGIKAYFGH